MELFDHRRQTGPGPLEKVWKNKRTEACTWASGSRMTRSWARHAQSRWAPICLSSPRRARLRMPPRSRAFSTCNSASLMVPFRPNSRRSVEVRRIVQPILIEDAACPASAHNSSSRCQSVVELRARSRYFKTEHDPHAPET